MFCISKPSRSKIDSFIATNKRSDFSYPYIRETKTGFRYSRKESGRQGYNVDHNHIYLGRGEQDFEKAKAAIKAWKMFDMPWVEICWPDTPIQEDETVAILIRHFGFHSLNAAKIVYTVDHWDRFGFAYGTLADHGESGEERFMVIMNRETGDVWYDLYAFSRPNNLLAKLGYPLVRNLQKRFATDSKSAMLRAMETIG